MTDRELFEELERRGYLAVKRGEVSYVYAVANITRQPTYKNRRGEMAEPKLEYAYFSFNEDEARVWKAEKEKEDPSKFLMIFTIPVHGNPAVKAVGQIRVKTPAGTIVAKELPDEEYPGIITMVEDESGQPASIVEYSPTAQGNTKACIECRVYDMKDPDDDPVFLTQMSKDINYPKSTFYFREVKA